MKDLLMKIYNANGYDELYEIVHTNQHLSDMKNWKPYGGIQNNCGTFEGQQSKPEAALIEKITNSIDAILMKECMLEGCDPTDKTDKNVPKSMTEAIEKYFSISKGKWESTTSTQRREIAQNLQLIVTGDRKSPDITIYDKGEGQNPENFENTFLSIHRGNKMDVPFVQGKFNMGSTGAVVFCGGYEKYQLIISRRCEGLSNSNGKIGFTLVRKHPLTPDEEKVMKSTWYEYFTINGDIPSFECDKLDLDLGLNSVHFTEGSVVKMYSYELSRGCQSDATLDLWRELNTLLYEASIPVLIWEKRDFKGHSKTKLMLGNKTRLAIDDRDKVYGKLSFSIRKLDIFGTEIPIEVAVFNHDIKNTEFIKNRSMVFIVNGQTQGSENKTFVSADLGFRQLRENMLISVDCTNIKTSVRSELFMSSRDRMKEGSFYNILKDEIIDILKHDDNLKQINQEYKGKVLRESKDDKELIETIFSSFEKNSDIKNLLKGNLGMFSFGQNQKKEDEKKENKKDKDNKENQIQLKRFPSFFRIKDTGLKEKDGNKYKAIPKGGKGVIKIETDAENEFLTRTHDKGELEINILDFGTGSSGGCGEHHPNQPTDKITVKRSGPYDGEIKLSIEPNENVNVGDMFQLSANLISADGNKEVIIMIGIEQEQQVKPPKEKKEEPEISLPKAIRVFKDKLDDDDDDTYITWKECDMSAKDVVQLAIGDNNAIEAIKINMDSNLIKKKINARGELVEDVRNRYIACIYGHSLVLYSSLLSYYSNEKNGFELDKGQINTLKDELNNTLESIFQIYGGFIMDFDSSIMQTN